MGKQASPAAVSENCEEKGWYSEHGRGVTCVKFGGEGCNTVQQQNATLGFLGALLIYKYKEVQELSSSASATLGLHLSWIAELIKTTISSRVQELWRCSGVLWGREGSARPQPALILSQRAARRRAPQDGGVAPPAERLTVRSRHAARLARRSTPAPAAARRLAAPRAAHLPGAGASAQPAAGPGMRRAHR